MAQDTNRAASDACMDASARGGSNAVVRDATAGLVAGLSSIPEGKSADLIGNVWAVFTLTLLAGLVMVALGAPRSDQWWPSSMLSTPPFTHAVNGCSCPSGGVEQRHGVAADVVRRRAPSSTPRRPGSPR
jgi:hypothetical protein